MKFKNLFLVVLVSVPLATFAQSYYRPARPALRAQISDVLMPVSVPVEAEAAADDNYGPPIGTQSTKKLANPNTGDMTVKNLTVTGKIKAREVQAGLNSVYIGSDSVGNYIKATNTATAKGVPTTANFLRIMFGATASDAIEKIRILANGYMGIGTTTPTYPLEVAGTIKSSNIITGSINPHSAGLAVRTNDIRVSNEFCLQDGTKTPIANPYGVSDAQWLSLKCFKYVCPAANGQWTLSQVACSIVTPPSTPTSTLSLATSADNVSSRQVVMGSANNVLHVVKLSAGNVEDIRVTNFAFFDGIANNSAGMASFNNLRLFDDAGTLLAGPVNMTITDATLGNIVFNIIPSLIVPKNGTKTIILKGDVATFISGGAKSGSSHVFHIGYPSTIIAQGKDSGVAAIVSVLSTPTAQIVYRTKPMLTSSVLGATTGRTRVAVDEIASMVWSANATDDLTISTVKVKLAGQAVASGTTAFSVSLIDANTNSGWGSAIDPQICSPIGSQCTVTFNPQFNISRGSSKAVKLRVNSNKFFNSANTSDSLSAIISASSDILWSDGTKNGIGFEPVQMPITLSNVSYQ